jgi:hypothetical protein
MAAKVTPEAKRYITMSLGIVATVLLITSVFLLVFVRTTTTTVVPTPTPTVTPTPTPLPTLELGQFSQKFNFLQSQLAAVVSPVASTVSGSIVSNSPYPSAPNQIPADQTISQPLQSAPQNLGFVTIDATGTQILGSMPNGEVAFAQFVLNSDTLTYKFVSRDYSDENFQNRIVQLVPATASQPESTALNLAASAVGCVGNRSIVLSDDELFLYVAYLDSTISQDSYFPLAQVVGKIQVWSRVPSSDSKNLNTDWSHNSRLVSDIQNPFGSQVAGLAQQVDGTPQGFNAFTETTPSGDEFGIFMRTTVDSQTGARVVAVGSNAGVNPRQGRCICVFQEQDNLSYDVAGVLTLPAGSEFDYRVRSTFGTAFDILDGTCLASFGTHDDPASTRLAHFRRDATSQVWQFASVVQPPVGTQGEFFGTSVALSSLGGLAFVGSPSSTNSGGSVYVLQESDLGVWTVSQTINDPWSSNTDFPNSMTFGWFVNVDPKSRVLSVTGNQDSAYKQWNPMMRKPSAGCNNFKDGMPTGDCNYTNLVFFPIDQQNASVVVDQSKNPRLYQDQFSNGSPSDKVDPLFGAKVRMEVVDDGVNVCTGSPVSGSLTLFLLGFR